MTADKWSVRRITHNQASGWIVRSLAARLLQFCCNATLPPYRTLPCQAELTYTHFQFPNHLHQLFQLQIHQFRSEVHCAIGLCVVRPIAFPCLHVFVPYLRISRQKIAHPTDDHFIFRSQSTVQLKSPHHHPNFSCSSIFNKPSSPCTQLEHPFSSSIQQSPLFRRS